MATRNTDISEVIFAKAKEEIDEAIEARTQEALTKCRDDIGKILNSIALEIKSDWKMETNAQEIRLTINMSSDELMDGMYR